MWLLVWIMVLTVSPSALLLSTDPYGFQRPNDFDYELYEELMSEYLVVLTRRSIKWSKLLKGKSKVPRNVKRECENATRATMWAEWAEPHWSVPPLLYSKALRPEGDSQWAPGSDLDGNQRGSGPAGEEPGPLPVPAQSPARPQTGGDHQHRWDPGLFIIGPIVHSDLPFISPDKHFFWERPSIKKYICFQPKDQFISFCLVQNRTLKICPRAFPVCARASSSHWHWKNSPKNEKCFWLGEKREETFRRTA